jgi:hypothetical protein
MFAAVRAEFRAPLWEVAGDHRYALYFTTAPGGEGVLLPAGGHDRWIFGILQSPADDYLPTHSEWEDLIAKAVGVPDLDIEVDHIARFTAAAQVAERFRVGNVFLVGDAAHRVTPRGGTGLNTAIAGGSDLGWKLSWVLQGWAAPSFLETYELERRPAATHNVERSADPTGSRRGPEAEVHNDLGGRIPHIWTADLDPAAPEARRSTLDLLGSGLTLFAAGEAREWHRAGAALDAAGHCPPVTVVGLDTPVARSLGLGSVGAVLVRPDAVPVASWWAPIDAEADIRRAIASLTEVAAGEEEVSPEAA